MSKSRKAVKRLIAALICVCLAFTLCFFAGRSLLKSLYPRQFDDFVESYAEKYNLEASLIYAVIKTESSFKPDAVSSAGALGLMQILPDTFTWLQTKTGESLDVQQLHDPETAIKYGALFYSMLMEKFGSVETSAAAYHAGMNRVSGWLKKSEYSADGKSLSNIPYASTADYVNKIVSAKIMYEKLYGI